MLTAIAAVSQSWGIGKNGDLLFNIPEDKKFFRKTTLNHTVVMGRKTLESLPNGKPFKDRRNIVLSRNEGFAPEGAEVFHSIEEILPVIDSASEEIFIAGGGEIYTAMLPHCKKAIITKISGDPEADTFFPNLDEDPEWVLESESEEQEFEGLKFRFCIYEKKKDKIGENNMDKLEQLKQWVEESERIVFFGGAGVSTESGIPDFRSVDGLYNQKYKFPPETILSRTFYVNNLADFYEFYRDKLLCLDAKPNKAHYALAKLEEAGKLTAVVTQNIDGLHQAAGSKTVYELHGSIHRNYCLRCGKDHPAEYIKSLDGPPPCQDCGGLVKPDVVLYEEGLNSATVNGAIEAIENADMLIIGGTSLSVYPASGLIEYYSGNKLVLINKTPTEKDDKADLLIHDSVGAALEFAASGISTD